MAETATTASSEMLALGITGDSHRDRLLVAMAEAIREQGFQRTTVADVVARARTSRRTFYQHFEDRESCYLALFQVVNERVLQVIAEAATGEGPWTERIDRTLAAYLGVLASEPELTRSYVQDLPAMGTAGAAQARQVVDRASRQLCRLVEEAREHDASIRPLSLEAATVITGGFRELTVLAMEQGRELTELHEVASDLVRRITMVS
ncbi:MAG TPA: TetR/AcrR family transcriptional regulator [Solirubrobacteraceae bacterium]|nr:TetR/AcrR family transcriptional regulator [Solirubrobacteraceae bacterium]